MPALQVRDFPATLYDQLKECAARNHRSIAQQTIIAVEEMLAASIALDTESVPSRERDFSTAEGLGRRCGAFEKSGYIGRCETDEAREARRGKRQQILKRFDEIPWKGPKPSTDEIVALVREGRDELSDRVWRALDPVALSSSFEGEVS
ncbi:argininosuccinate lyase [Adlercreutzia sp. R25]|uniref:Argininosuccinate lyase n=1 Tax=Adlercreutzia shanghongiae TaxID=3111773 RepID=A0ABU6IZ74_9ACTN|nr:MULTISPECIES: argininosuccinate lyase [unclassified Adlercreutzia]MEC4273053.1 argininosuccinate lyase [Adlercreutzia sp. R25]MEC4295157.1 argininosuccinate lyase [Adlercreutzia sp. R22]